MEDLQSVALRFLHRQQAEGNGPLQQSFLRLAGVGQAAHVLERYVRLSTRLAGPVGIVSLAVPPALGRRHVGATVVGRRLASIADISGPVLSGGSLGTVPPGLNPTSARSVGSLSWAKVERRGHTLPAGLKTVAGSVVTAAQPTVVAGIPSSSGMALVAPLISALGEQPRRAGAGRQALVRSRAFDAIMSAGSVSAGAGSAALGSTLGSRRDEVELPRRPRVGGPRIAPAVMAGDIPTRATPATTRRDGHRARSAPDASVTGQSGPGQALSWLPVASTDARRSQDPLALPSLLQHQQVVPPFPFNDAQVVRGDAGEHRLAAPVHPPPAAGRQDPGEQSPFVGEQSKALTLSGDIHMSGRMLGQVAASGMGRDAALPARGPARFNARVVPIYSGTRIPQ